MSAAGKADVRRVTPAAARWVLHQRPSLEFRGGGPLLLGVVALQHSVEVTVDVRPVARRALATAWNGQCPQPAKGDIRALETAAGFEPKRASIILGIVI
jgi:hypothetical protein